MFTGSCVALVTPMTSNGEIDYPSLEKLVEWHINQGTDAIVVAGTTGESATLSFKETTSLIKTVVSIVNHQIPVIAGTGTNSTDTTIERTQSAKQLGCDAALLVAPYYIRPMQEGLYLHYKKIAESIDFPIILYNVPARTASDILPETVVRLSKISNIIGIKEATGDLNRISTLVEQCRPDFRLYSGDDGTCFEFMRRGGQGVISVAANVVPKIMHNLCMAVFSDQIDIANTLNEELTNLYKRLGVESNPIPVKWALFAMGKIAEGIRLPLTPLSKEHQNAVIEAVRLVESIGEMNV